MNSVMNSVMNKIDIESKVAFLKSKGLKENIDFRIVYFSNQAEIKMIGQVILTIKVALLAELVQAIGLEP